MLMLYVASGVWLGSVWRIVCCWRPWHTQFGCDPVGGWLAVAVLGILGTDAIRLADGQDFLLDLNDKTYLHMTVTDHNKC